MSGPAVQQAVRTASFGREVARLFGSDTPFRELRRSASVTDFFRLALLDEELLTSPIRFSYKRLKRVHAFERLTPRVAARFFDEWYSSGDLTKIQVVIELASIANPRRTAEFLSAWQCPERVKHVLTLVRESARVPILAQNAELARLFVDEASKDESPARQTALARLERVAREPEASRHLSETLTFAEAIRIDQMLSVKYDSETFSAEQVPQYLDDLRRELKAHGIEERLLPQIVSNSSIVRQLHDTMVRPDGVKTTVLEKTFVRHERHTEVEEGGFGEDYSCVAHNVVGRVYRVKRLRELVSKWPERERAFNILKAFGVYVAPLILSELAEVRSPVRLSYEIGPEGYRTYPVIFVPQIRKRDFRLLEAIAPQLEDAPTREKMLEAIRNERQRGCNLDLAPISRTWTDAEMEITNWRYL